MEFEESFSKPNHNLTYFCVYKCFYVLINMKVTTYHKPTIAWNKTAINVFIIKTRKRVKLKILNTRLNIFI